ncbi:hypothetical protein [Pelagibacterium sp.]|uniref:hypothetical protein n=1 Tax=Pelagibacterium sp. TaxID=1967288 RepID=UPI003A8EAA07
MKITRSADCKNSPKNAFVEELVIGLFTGANLATHLQDGAALPGVPEGVSAVDITHAISHGKIGAANGTMTVGGVQQPFAIFIEFSSTKATLVKSLSLYSITSK